MEIIIIGAGAAGLMAAIAAARSGAEVTLLEKNEKTGKKIYITGKGRCNVTNACDSSLFFRKIPRNPRFLYSSYGAFGSQDMMDLLEQAGLPLKVERGERVFPVSDHASDVTATLERQARSLGVRIKLHTTVTGIAEDNGICTGVYAGKCFLPADRVIVATGGLSYPTTGSTGDGYEWARRLGHTIEPTSPSLVPVLAGLHNYDISQLAGLSLKNVTLHGKISGKNYESEVGELLFTHMGISGPLVLTLSAGLSGMKEFSAVKLAIDWKPGMSEEELDARLLREFDMAKNKSLKNVMHSLLPAGAIPAVLAGAGIDGERQINSITKEDRRCLLRWLKSFDIDVLGLGGYNEAVITRGGISVKEINPKTMESKIIKNLYFAGEIIDVDGCTGGFNLQIAWSTGHAAGIGAAQEDWHE